MLSVLSHLALTFSLHSKYTDFAAAAVAKSLQSCPTLCDPIDGSPPGSPVPGISRQEHWSGLPFPSPMHESEKWKWSCSVVSDPPRPHGLQRSRLLRPEVFQARVLKWGAIARANAYPSKALSKNCRGRNTSKFILQGHHHPKIQQRQHTKIKLHANTTDEHRCKKSSTKF